MTIKALYPTVRPSLNLDFAKTKALDPRVTFTRASTATFVGANGLIQTAASGVPRFDHNPETGESLGLLVEEARTNLATYSDQLGNAIWTKVGLSIFTANAVAAPNGTLTGSFIAWQNATSPLTSGLGLQYGVGIAAGTNTLSCFAKMGTARYLALGLTNNGGETSTAIFDLQTGTVSGSGSHPSFTVNGTSMVSAGAGWYRCSLTSTYAAGMVIHISSSTSGLSGVYGRDVSGDGTSGIYVWGAQIEASASFPTSYIPTTTATVTRAADVASMTGTNFSSWYRQDEGTFLATVPATPSVTGYILDCGNTAASGAGASGHNLYITSSSAGGLTEVSGSTVASPVANYTGNTVRASYAYKINNFNAAVNGTLGTLDTNGAIPTLGAQQLFIGGRFNTTSLINRTLARLTYYPVRLPDAQFQALTAT